MATVRSKCHCRVDGIVVLRQQRARWRVPVGQSTTSVHTAVGQAERETINTTLVAYEIKD